MIKVAQEYRRLVSICPEHLHRQFFEDAETRVLLDEDGSLGNPTHLPSL